MVTAFPDLSLHNRLALVVPDAAFLERLRPELCKALDEHFPKRCFCLVDAITASADLGRSFATEHEGQDDCDDADCGKGEWLVCDTINQLDGLERLVVLAVGLDSIINSEDSNTSVADGAPLETRSMLYRAVTRAHLMFLVVNEFLRGGWLEFLGSVRLRDDQAFNSAAELKNTEVQAVEEFVKTALTKAINTAAEQQGVKLGAPALSLLASNAASFQDAGFDGEAAVRAVLQSWTSAEELVISTLQHVSKQARLSLPPGEKYEILRMDLTIAVMRGETANLSAAALDALKREVCRERDARIKEALQVAAGERKLDTALLAVLIPRIALIIAGGESMLVAAQAAVEEWRQTEVQIAAVMDDRIGKLDLKPSTVLKVSLYAAAVAAICSGEAIEQAVETSLRKWQKESADKAAASALEAAMAHAIAHVPICANGVRASLSGLVKKPSLNGKEGTIESFVVDKRRWTVQLDTGGLVLLKENNLNPIREAIQRQPQCSVVEAMPMLQAAVHDIIGHGEGQVEVADAAQVVVTRWRALEAQVVSALEEASVESQLHVVAETLANLAQQVIRSLWKTSDGVQQLVASLGEDGVESDEDQEDPFEAAITATLSDWEQQAHLEQKDIAQIAAAIEAKANSERLLLSDAAAASLQQRVASALRRGETLDAAVIAVLRDWQRQLVRRQVQQTVWDPSGNSTRKVTGVVRFMPFKRDCEHFDFWVLANAFAFLPFQQHAVIARVCKRWRNVAADPSWKPELVAYAWGDADVTGLSVHCPKPTLLEFSLSKQIMRIACTDDATFALTEAGTVWFWGSSWLPGVEDTHQEPTQLEELSDVVSVTATPPGYFHGRGARGGYSCAAVTRRGDLYTWGVNSAGQLFHGGANVRRPRRVVDGTAVWQPATERVLHASCGLDYIALCVDRRGQFADVFVNRPGQAPTDPTTSVITCGRFCDESGFFGRDRRRVVVEEPIEWQELRGVPLRQLQAGAFHCCALTPRGELYTFGHRYGRDHANGNLLGCGDPDRRAEPIAPPQQVVMDGLGPIAEVACSTYCTVAVTVDGRAFSWGDCDGDALGHTTTPCHSPIWLRSLRWHRVSRGGLSYTNGAVATDEGRVFVWGGNAWEGGIAGGRNISEPSEVKWSGVPSCYRCTSVALAHKHGYLIFRKLP